MPVSRSNHASSETIEQRLLEVLRGHRSGLRKDQIRQRIVATGAVVDLSTVTAQLRELQKKGVVNFKSQRWTLKHPHAAKKPVSKPMPPKKPATRRRPEGGSQESEVSPTEAEDPVPCLPFRANTVDAQQPPPKTLDSGLPTGWPLLRQLIPYWRECLRAEERPNTILPMERANTEFCGLTTADAWWPTERRSAEFTIAVDHLPAELLATLARHGTESDIFIGYPLQLIPGTRDRSAFARPIFTFACGLEMTSGTLRLTLPPQPVDINADWLEKQFPNPIERRNVLRWLGIVGAVDQDDDPETQTPGEPLDLPTATVRLGAYLPPDSSGELTPTALATSLPVHTQKPRVVNVLTLFAASTTKYSKRTLADLDKLTEWTEEQFTESALSAVFTKSDHPEDCSVPVLSPLPLNEEQFQATRRALNQNLTVITGPPGTGKSQAVAAIMASAALIGRSALLASKNHKALDAVEQRMGELLSHDRNILARVSRPYGTGQGFNLQRAADSLFARGASTGDRTKLESAVARLERIDQRLVNLEKRLQYQADLGDQVAEAEAHIEECEFELTERQRAWILREATRPLPSPPPEDTEYSRLPRLLGSLWRWYIARRRRKFLARLAPLEIPWSSDDEQQRVVIYRRMLKYRDALSALDAAKTELLPESEAANLTDQVVDGRLDLEKQAEELFQALPNALEDLDDETRPELAELSGAMAIFAGEKLGNEGTKERRRVMQRALPQLLKHFPLWAVTNLSAGRALPLTPGLFDYVIIDEASQCDIASAVPLLARAKRAVIVGDPAQLRHVTKLTQEREQRLLESNKLLASGIGRWSYRSQSLFNIAAAIPGVSSHMLRDHYRSADAIADYCNEVFYGGRLRVLTDENALRPPAGKRCGIHWSDVRGPILPATSGCHAPDEAEAIVKHLRHLLCQEDYAGTIGVVTPFREQAKRITDRLAQEIPADRISRAQLGAFTAHQFQGDARDLILMSLCLGPDMPAGSRTFVAESGNLMNVAVSRARAVCHVFGNQDAARQSTIPHIVKLARAADHDEAQHVPVNSFESPWEEKLYNALKQRGIESVPQFPVAGRRLDLAVISNGIKLDVEVDGDRWHRDPSGRRKSSDLWRDHQLRSLGWCVKRYWVYQLRENMDGCVDDIIAAAGGRTSGVGYPNSPSSSQTNTPSGAALPSEPSAGTVPR